MDTSTDHMQSDLDQKRFSDLWESKSINFNPEHCGLVFDQLSSLYRSDGRFYHSEGHINQCLLKLDEARSEHGPQPDVEMATWFHDAVYRAGSSDNEKNSAIWFQDRARDHLNRNTVDEVSNLITITEHRNQPASEREKLMVDVDLSSFGLPYEEFIRDGRNIRKEFHAYSDDEFVEGQRKFMNSLLDRSSIYSTDYFFRRYEKSARENIQQLLKMYDQGFRP